MLKKEVREWVKYLVSERKSFKVIFANGLVEVVEYKGYCWVMNNKGYSDEELVEKMVRFQNNEKKFIVKFEEVEEVKEEVKEEVAIEESLVEEVENLNDDLFQEEDIKYSEEAIERENVSRETYKKENNKMTNYEIKMIKRIQDKITYLMEEKGYSPYDISVMLDDFIYDNDFSNECNQKLWEIQDKYIIK